MTSFNPNFKHILNPSHRDKINNLQKKQTNLIKEENKKISEILTHQITIYTGNEAKTLKIDSMILFQMLWPEFKPWDYENKVEIYKADSLFIKADPSATKNRMTKRLLIRKTVYNVFSSSRLNTECPKPDLWIAKIKWQCSCILSKKIKTTVNKISFSITSIVKPHCQDKREILAQQSAFDRLINLLRKSDSTHPIHLVLLQAKLNELMRQAFHNTFLMRTNPIALMKQAHLKEYNQGSLCDTESEIRSENELTSETESINSARTPKIIKS